MPNLHYLQHVPYEGLAAIEPWAVERGWSISRTRLFAGEALPDARDFDWLVVLGGPMGVYETDQYAWLEPEFELTAAATAAGLPVLGVCLGAQIMARALGADVAPHHTTEIGWFDVETTAAAAGDPLFAEFPEKLTVLHWHGDIFAIPDGAVHLATSAACENQAFRHGERAIGLQFHIEATAPWVRGLIGVNREKLTGAGCVQTPDQLEAGLTHCPAIHAALDRLLTRLVG